jgi:hypothetical protein
MTAVSALGAAPAYAAAASTAAVPAPATGWTFYATYPDLPTCQAAGPTNPYGAAWQCVPSMFSPSPAHDLQVWL